MYIPRRKCRPEYLHVWYEDKLPGGTDPTGAALGSFRVYRGGGWDRHGWYCRSAGRGREPSRPRSHRGFRVTLAPSGKLLPNIPSTPLSNLPLKVGQKAGEAWNGNSLQMPFCWCPPGKFVMGSPTSEVGRNSGLERQVEVTLTQGFWLGKFEVTQAEFQVVMKKNPSQYQQLAQLNTAKFPVESVTWTEADNFCRKLTEQEREGGRLPDGWEYRLPTYAQWEYACRAGTTTATAFGDQIGSQQANVKGEPPYNGAEKGPYLRRPTTVGRYAANAWGLHDMHGNVWEWCQDWAEYSRPGGTDPVGDLTGTLKTARGGAWNDPAALSRSANRRSNNIDYQNNGIGFRVALVPSGK